MSLSVVIPTLNSAHFLRACIECIRSANEVIVADGGSSDGTPEIAAKLGARVIEAARGRGVQLAAGAAAATCDWLLFLHADTLLGEGWESAVSRHVMHHPFDAACFAFRLDHAGWQPRLLEAGVSLRGRALALPYGDQGLLISRTHYDAIGGFRPLALMEDVDIVRRIGRRRLRHLAVPAVTSADRWRQDGWWRRSARNLSCLALYGLGVSPERIARFYA